MYESRHSQPKSLSTSSSTYFNASQNFHSINPFNLRLFILIEQIDCLFYYNIKWIQVTIHFMKNLAVSINMILDMSVHSARGQAANATPFRRTSQTAVGGQLQLCSPF